MHIIVSILKTLGVVLLVELLWVSVVILGYGLVYGAMAGFSNEGPLYAEDALLPIIIGAVGVFICGALALRYRELTDSRVVYWVPVLAVLGAGLLLSTLQNAMLVFVVAFVLKLVVLFSNQRSSYGT